MSSRGRRGRRPREKQDDGWENWGGGGRDYMSVKRQMLLDQFTEQTPAAHMSVNKGGRYRLVIAQYRSKGGGGGGYMAAKRQKLLDQFTEQAPGALRREGSSGSTIFHGITIHVNGYTKPSSDELKRLMMMHGGSYEHYLRRRRVSHVIASNLPDSKIRELKGLKVVSPEWITESITAGKLLSYTDYQLYTAKTGRQQGLQGFTVNQSEHEQPLMNQSGNNIDEENQTAYSESVDCDTSGTGIRSKSSNQNNEQGSSLDADDTENINPLLPENLDDNDSHIALHTPEINRNERIPVGSTESSSASNTDHDTGLATRARSTRTSTSGIRPVQETKTSPPAVSQNHSPGPAYAGDPKFLSEFYTNSRLHHLSTWKAEFKNYVNELQNKGDNFTGREKLRALVQQREINDMEEREIIEMENGARSSSGKPKRCVMHVDMDCFFVSVGLRKRPDLRGKPVAVTHSKGKGAPINPEADFNFEKKQYAAKTELKANKGKKTPTKVASDLSFPDLSDSEDDDDNNGSNVSHAPPDFAAIMATDSFHSMAEVASCNYEARKAGVRNGMFMGTAKRHCPNLITIPYDFDGYKSVSRCLYDTVASFTHDVEAVSCDEMLVDCTDLLADTGASPLVFAEMLREEIYAKTGCPASAGIASNILLAKMATRKAKPNGQYHLTDAEVAEFIIDQTVKDIPGVGWSITKRFEKMGVLTCGDLQKVAMDTLQREFGPKTGQSLFRYCRGQDDRPIKIEQQRKSVSAEVNYGIRFKTAGESVKFVQELAEEVCSRLKNISMKGKTVTLKLMVRRQDAPRETSKFMGHGICTNFSKSVTLPLPTDDAIIVGKECVGILKQHRAAAEDLRGIGIQIQRLESAVPGLANAKSKGQSILNFAVNKSTREKTSPELPKDDNSKTNTHKSPENQSESCILGHKDQSESLLQRGNMHNQSDGVLQKDEIQSVQHEEESEVVPDWPELLQENGRKSPFHLIDDLAWRQVSPNKLPPLPCLPDLSQRSQTPTNTRSSSRRQTPADTAGEDYFPSPSQVDQDVLNELPPEIREQIERELESRKKKKRETLPASQITTRKSSTGPGCSHWEGERGSHSASTIVDKGGHSGSTVVEKGENSSGSVGTHDADAIVALPSPSQIDPSCLSALPESLQRELKEAYARQGTAGVRQGDRGTGTMMNLQQARSPTKSPSKSPGKKSPLSKRSPQFKVPRGRPSKRGRKKATSKKLLFKDNALTEQQVVIPEESPPMTVYDVDEDVIIQQTSLNEQPETGSHANENRTRILTPDLSETVAHSDTVEEGCAEVNLCGAIDIQGVRDLIKEWIASTEEPQPVDEEILAGYLQDLILDRNLEQVDLVLKFMYRHIRYTESAAWMGALQNIYWSTQAVVQNMYGSRLCSVSL